MRWTKPLILLATLAANPAHGNPANQLMQQQSQGERTAALAKVVESSGQGACSGTDSQFIGIDKDQAAYYRVDCGHGESFMVQIAADSAGSTSVVACSLMKLINVDCFTPW